MLRPLRYLLLLLFPCAPALAALTASSCVEGGQACYQGDWRACTCEDGAAGYQQCAEDGAGYGACDCSGTIPGLSAAACDGGKLPFMTKCTEDEECETGLCYSFNAKGPHCTQPCSADTECPPPSSGCNNMGVCKAP